MKTTTYLTVEANSDWFEIDIFAHGARQAICQDFREKIQTAKDNGEEVETGINEYGDVYAIITKGDDVTKYRVVSEERAQILCPEYFE